MPELKWTSPRPLKGDHEYVVFASLLPAEGIRAVPSFMRHTQGITRQLRESRGLVAYALRADIIGHRFWTLSVWESPEDLQAFAAAEPHATTMRKLARHTRQPLFSTWKTSAPLPLPSWQEVAQRLQEVPQPQVA